MRVNFTLKPPTNQQIMDKTQGKQGKNGGHGVKLRLVASELNSLAGFFYHSSLLLEKVRKQYLAKSQGKVGTGHHYV